MNKQILFLLMLAIFSIACNSKKSVEQTSDAISGSGVTAQANFPEWSHDAVIYEVNLRQYTPEGTIAAFEKHLPRLKELGVEILWFMPIHPISEKNRKGSMGSYYAVQNYKAVNPEFGTFDDFKKLVSTCHEMGFKVILDWVANHTGWDNPWITSNPEWYTTDSLGNIIPPVPDWSDVADLNYDNNEMRAAMIDALTFWVAEANIDGYRCDVAGEVPVDFWEDARVELDKVKPVYMLAEDESTTALLNSAFNSNYGWHFHHIINQIAKGQMGVADVKGYFEKVDTTYPVGSYAMQFTSNHDENSWHGSAPERLGDALKTMAALTFTVPGMPLIYSGQEARLNRKLAFFEKDEIDWSNLELQSFYARLVDIKQENPALWNGNAGAPIHFLNMHQQNSLLAFSRTKGDNKVVALFNLSAEPVSNTITNGEVQGAYADLVTGEPFEVLQNGEVVLQPWEFKILKSVSSGK